MALNDAVQCADGDIFLIMDADAVPTIDLSKLELQPTTDRTWLQPISLYEISGTDGQTVRLCDFAAA